MSDQIPLWIACATPLMIISLVVKIVMLISWFDEVGK